MRSLVTSVPTTKRPSGGGRERSLPLFFSPSLAIFAYLALAASCFFAHIFGPVAALLSHLFHEGTARSYSMERILLAPSPTSHRTGLM